MQALFASEGKPSAAVRPLPGARPPLLSVVVPVRDEVDNILPLLEEIVSSMAELKESYEIIYVDDGSRDGTLELLRQEAAVRLNLRVVTHGTGRGQSAAIRSGAAAARGRFLVTLDGDGQNDPRDIALLLETLRAAKTPSSVGLVAGQRLRREDSFLRRLSSRIANGLRSRVLGDGISDTGCGLKLLDRELFLALPYFDHMHRFLPALVQREGREVLTVPVSHRPRTRGRSKYGVANRLWVGLVDLCGVAWLLRRGGPAFPKEL